MPYFFSEKQKTTCYTRDDAQSTCASDDSDQALLKRCALNQKINHFLNQSQKISKFSFLFYRIYFGAHGCNLIDPNTNAL
jgi:hypothetical protein